MLGINWLRNIIRFFFMTADLIEIVCMCLSIRSVCVFTRMHVCLHWLQLCAQVSLTPFLLPPSSFALLLHLCAVTELLPIMEMFYPCWCWRFCARNEYTRNVVHHKEKNLCHFWYLKMDLDEGLREASLCLLKSEWGTFKKVSWLYFLYPCYLSFENM